MSKTQFEVPLHGSRLNNYLSDLGITSPKLTQHNFAERVGELLGLSGSLALSNAPLKVKGTHKVKNDNGVQALFLEQHSQMLQFIANCFDRSDSRKRFQLPIVTEETEKPMAEFKRFYINVENELAGQVFRLHALIKDAVSDISPSLKQLCTLDTALNETINSNIRKAFNSIPYHVEQRFHYWQQQIFESFDVAMASFSQELKQLLITELDARLQPTYGLVEAVNEQVSTRND